MPAAQVPAPSGMFAGLATGVVICSVLLQSRSFGARRVIAPIELGCIIGVTALLQRLERRGHMRTSLTVAVLVGVVLIVCSAGIALYPGSITEGVDNDLTATACTPWGKPKRAKGHGKEHGKRHDDRDDDDTEAWGKDKSPWRALSDAVTSAVPADDGTMTDSGRARLTAQRAKAGAFVWSKVPRRLDCKFGSMPSSSQSEGGENAPQPWSPAKGGSIPVCPKGSIAAPDDGCIEASGALSKVPMSEIKWALLKSPKGAGATLTTVFNKQFGDATFNDTDDVCRKVDKLTTTVDWGHPFQDPDDGDTLGATTTGSGGIGVYDLAARATVLADVCKGPDVTAGNAKDSDDLLGVE